MFQAHLECGVGVKLDLPGDLAYGESGTPRGGERRVNDGAGVGRMAHLWYQERIPTSGDEDLMAFVAHEVQVKEDSWRGEERRGVHDRRPSPDGESRKVYKTPGDSAAKKSYRHTLASTQGGYYICSHFRRVPGMNLELKE